MSGIDAIRGFDYQISYTLFLIVSFLKDKVKGIDKFKFESINENEEDFNIFYENGTIDYIQIKKKDESNMWSASEMQRIFDHYMKNYNDNSNLRFITNGSANRDVKKLKKIIKDQKYDKSIELIQKFKPNNCETSQFIKILNSISIETLAMTSNNENDISMVVKKETIQMLNNASFFLKDQVSVVYDKLWKYIFDLSKNGEEISFIELKKQFNKYGVEYVSSELWLKFPSMNEFAGRDSEMKLLTQISKQEKRISVFGISGIGKSYMAASWAKNMLNVNENVCWISLRANMTYSKLINILGSFVETVLKVNSFKDELEGKEISEQIDSISNILEKYRVIFVLDSYEKASGNVEFFLNRIFNNIKKSGESIMLVTTTQRMKLYTESDIKLGKVHELILDELSYQDITLYYEKCDMTSEEIRRIWEAIGGFPISNSLLMSYIKSNDKNIQLSELINLTKEEKNQFIFNSIYKDLPVDEKKVLEYLSSMDYGFNEYEEKIIEKILRTRINYTLKSLAGKNLLKYDGSVYYLHDTIRLIIYDQIIDDEKVRIHQLFEKKYSKRLFEFRKEESYLSDKWGYHVCQLSKLNALKDARLMKIITLDEKLQFDLWGIKWTGYPYEFKDATLKNTELRIKFLESEGYIIRNQESWILNGDMFSLPMLFLIEYLLKKRYSAMSMALGYIPIFLNNYSFYKQNIICEWEHCIEYMPLEKGRGLKSCPIFGHNCPEGERHVTICRKLNS